MSELSTLIKRQRLSDCNKNKETQLNYKLFIGDRFKDTQIENKITEYFYYVNSNNRKSGLLILILDN